MSQNRDGRWYSALNVMLNEGVSDKSIIEFIEKSVPEDEARIFDFKRELYLTSNEDAEHDKRRAQFAELCAGLANVFHQSDFRYIFVGFDDQGDYIGIDYLGAHGGDHIFDVDDQSIQNALRDHVEPEPIVEKHRLRHNNDKGVILTVEKASSRPIVVKKTVVASNDRIITQGVAPFRRGSETTTMTHANFRDLIEHREDVLSKAFESLAEDFGKVIGMPTDELQDVQLSFTSDPDAPAVRDVIVPKKARNADQDLNARMVSWFTDEDLPGDVSVIYKFYNTRDSLDLSNVEKSKFLFHSCVANYVPGTEWLLKIHDDWNNLFNDVIQHNYNHSSILMLERILLILGWRETLQGISSNDDIQYKSSKADQYAKLCDKPTLSRLQEYVGKYVRHKDTSYRVEKLLFGEVNTEPLFDEIVTYCAQGNQGKADLRDIELVRLGKMASDKFYQG